MELESETDRTFPTTDLDAGVDLHRMRARVRISGQRAAQFISEQNARHVPLGEDGSHSLWGEGGVTKKGRKLSCTQPASPRMLQSLR